MKEKIKRIIEKIKDICSLYCPECGGRMECWIEYEKNNKDKINKADELIYIQETILQDYKRVLKENEELKISNKEIDKECSRLEKKEVELINENEHYEDLIYALKTYYNITREDLEKCMKNDR